MMLAGGLLVINYLMVSHLFFKKESISQKFLSVPLIQVLFSFFGLYIFLFFLYSYLTLPVNLILITYLVILLINSFTFYRVYLATSIVQSIEKKQTNASEFVREFGIQLMATETTITSVTLKKKFKTIKDELKYSAPLSQPSVVSIENKMSKLLNSTNFNEIEESEADVVINQIKALIDNRNLLLKK
jgi:signal transduction histidine kinase